MYQMCCSTIGPITMTRILIIEDEELVRLTVKQMLEAAEHEVSTAVDGEDGLRQFRQQPADIVLCDVFMPNKDGIATLKELHEVSADVPVIMMSGGVPAPMLGETGPVDYLRLARLLGAASTITKPFQTSHLLAAMETCLSTVDAP